MNLSRSAKNALLLFFFSSSPGPQCSSIVVSLAKVAPTTRCVFMFVKRGELLRDCDVINIVIVSGVFCKHL